MLGLLVGAAIGGGAAGEPGFLSQAGGLGSLAPGRETRALVPLVCILHEFTGSPQKSASAQMEVAKIDRKKKA